MTRFLGWAIRMAVWLTCMDAISWWLGVEPWKAMAIGAFGVVCEEAIGLLWNGLGNGTRP